MIPLAQDPDAMEQRVWSRLRLQGDCWVWDTPVPQSLPRPRVSYRGRGDYAYRVAFEALRGEIPDGLTIDHLCHNPLCCNPWHLDPVPNSVNARRQREHDMATVTHCVHGHEWTDDNTRYFTTRRGTRSRYCRECNRQRTRRYYRTNRKAS